MVLGVAALLTGKTGEIITIAVFGALTLYFVSMLAFIKLRKSHPDLPRPFRSPGYPYLPWIALLISVTAIMAMAFYNFRLIVIYAGIIAFAFVIYLARKKSV